LRDELSARATALFCAATQRWALPLVREQR
jgi:hypothetical protein